MSDGIRKRGANTLKRRPRSVRRRKGNRPYAKFAVRRARIRGEMKKIPRHPRKSERAFAPERARRNRALSRLLAPLLRSALPDGPEIREEKPRTHRRDGTFARRFLREREPRNQKPPRGNRIHPRAREAHEIELRGSGRPMIAIGREDRPGARFDGQPRPTGRRAVPKRAHRRGKGNPARNGRIRGSGEKEGRRNRIFGRFVKALRRDHEPGASRNRLGKPLEKRGKIHSGMRKNHRFLP